MSWFTDEELEKLIKAAVTVQPLTERRIERFLGWCTEQRVGSAVVDALLAGKVRVIIDPKKRNFDPQFEAVE